jgi:iron(III) transport system substrate-binding protein
MIRDFLRIPSFGLSFVIRASLFVILIALASGCHRQSSTVVLYTSQDREYAEPILQEFTRRSGIKVKTLYDTEAAKTVGLASRLLAEKSHPRCDVFWNNEELRTWQLAAKGALETNWATMGYRSRMLVMKNPVNGPIPSLADLTNHIWRGKVALAYPLFGTTATHFLALRQHWGAAAWENWCRALQANKPFLVDGNSAVVRFVARGEASVGLTDSDDIAAGQREGLPITGVARSGTPRMFIPNTVALVVRRPHVAEAQRLFEFLQQPEIARRLVEAHALESADKPESVAGRLQVNYPELLRDLDAATRTLEQVFLK